MKLTLKKIDPVRFALIYATVIALVMFIILAIVLLFGSLFGAAFGGEMGPLGAVVGGGFLALIFGPIIYFVIVFIITWIGASIFNFVAAKYGGLDLHFDNSSIEISNIGKE